MSKYEVFSGPDFPAFGLNTERYVFSPNAGKYGLEKTPYLNTFHAVKLSALQNDAKFTKQNGRLLTWNLKKKGLNKRHSKVTKNDKIVEIN